jgi:hypothetical protein
MSIIYLTTIKKEQKMKNVKKHFDLVNGTKEHQIIMRLKELMIEQDGLHNILRAKFDYSNEDLLQLIDEIYDGKI